MRIKSAPAAAKPYPRYAACDSITNFGAVGNGTADDAVALRKAINAVGSGCSIYFPPGVYKLASNVTINKDITFQLGPQVEIRQFARLIPDSHGVRSLTVVGEGPGTSIWAQAVGSPFWSGPDLPMLKSLRLLNLEFRPYAQVGWRHQYGGSTDMLEMNNVTVSPGSANPYDAFGTEARADTRTQAPPNRTVLTDVSVYVNLRLFHQNKDLDITRFTARCPDSASIELVRGAAGTSQIKVSSFSLEIGGNIGGPISDSFNILSTNNGSVLNVVMNDVEIFTSSHKSALRVEARGGAELRLLANSLRFRTVHGSTTGYAIQTEDQTGAGVVRAVFAGGFLQSSTLRSGAAIQGSLANANSLRTIAGMDQRGWASLT
jgi:hypothetical protein